MSASHKFLTNLASATIFPSLARPLYRDHVLRCLEQQYPRMTQEIHSLAQIRARVRYRSRAPEVIVFFCVLKTKG